MHHAGRIRIILYCEERTNTKEHLPRTYYWTTTVGRRGCISIIFVNVLGLSCSWYMKRYWIWSCVPWYPGFHLEIRHTNLKTKSALLWPQKNLYLSGIEESARTLPWCWMSTGRKSQEHTTHNTQPLTCFVQQCFLVEIQPNNNLRTKNLHLKCFVQQKEFIFQGPPHLLLGLLYDIYSSSAPPAP